VGVLGPGLPISAETKVFELVSGNEGPKLAGHSSGSAQGVVGGESGSGDSSEASLTPAATSGVGIPGEAANQNPAPASAAPAATSGRIEAVMVNPFLVTKWAGPRCSLGSVLRLLALAHRVITRYLRPGGRSEVCDGPMAQSRIYRAFWPRRLTRCWGRSELPDA